MTLAATFNKERALVGKSLVVTFSGHRGTSRSPADSSSAGSLPRPPAVLAHLDSGEEELPSSVLETAVMETVRRQIEADM